MGMLLKQDNPTVANKPLDTTPGGLTLLTEEEEVVEQQGTKRKRDSVLPGLTDEEIQETGEILAEISGGTGKDIAKERSERYKRVLRSKNARELPSDLDSQGETPVGRETEDVSSSGDHLIGVIATSGQKRVGDELVAANLRAKAAKEKNRGRRESNKDRAVKERADKQEREDYTSGKLPHTTEQLHSASEARTKNYSMKMKKLTVSPTLDGLPRRTLDEYNARNNEEGYMLASLKEIDKKELEIVRKLPDSHVNSRFLLQIKEQAPFYQQVVKVHVTRNVKVPIPEMVDWDYASAYYRECIVERGERPCINGATGACVVLQDFGFVCREFLKKKQADKFNQHRLRDPNTCQEALPFVQGMCLGCAQVVVTDTYFTRVSNDNHKDRKTEMEDGSSQTLDNCEVISDIQFDVHAPGQYDIKQCIGVGDNKWYGVPGPFIPWDKNNYILDTTTLIDMSREQKKSIEKSARMKRAYQKQQQLERETRGGLSDDMYRDMDGKLCRRGTTSRAPQQVFRTTMGSPVPGSYTCDYDDVDPRTGLKNSTVQREIKRLIQRECLRFQQGAMPVKIVRRKTSSPSILTGSE